MNGNTFGKNRHARFFSVAKKAILLGGKVVLGLLTCAVLLVFFKAVTRAPVVKADSSVYYPSFCAGGWQNSQNASGQSDLPAGDQNAADFNISNSAFLASSVASQIFCGYFSVDSQPNPPSDITLTFNWAAPSLQTTQAPTQSQQTSQTQATSTSQSSSGQSNTSQIPSGGGSGGSLSSSSGLIIATSTGFTVSSTSPAVSTTPDTSDSSSSSPSASPAATSSASATPTVTSTPTPTPTPTTPAQATTPVPSDDSSSDSGTTATPPAAAPAPVTTPTPTPSDSSSGSSPTSFLYKVLDTFAKTAYGDSSGFAQSDAFFRISYSTDGVNWHIAGTVAASNFQGYAIILPISSWDDLKNLQVMIDTLPTVGAKPDVYLESIALTVNYNNSIIGDISNDAAAVDAAANAAAAALDNVVQPTVTPVPYVPPPPVMRLMKRTSFAVGTNQIAARKDLPWYPKDFSKQAARSQFDARLSLKKSTDASSLVISGVCNSDYFVVLVYRNQDDYINHPASFLYDAGNPCGSDGTFSFDMATLSLNIPDGTYYLLIGSEGAAGTWIPISPIVPITINSAMVETPVASTTQSQ